ncbi:hypothetical protein [Hymenobacter aerophilus]|uniref:hypothetical protein n=1 Tax=Hymenobacter aerophilus TaxID=119644 RepID=UPI0003676940|nr:hypothetical protein [Hymenobacter aerophilus]
MLFRNRRLVRAVSCFLLLETVGSLLSPTVSWALMGPGQPEFISYEAPGATDIVNLTTGDLTYQLPLLEVPGPERSFSLPLTYRAGIKLEQEASWVGLGWTLNPGAIARNLNNYPDDASSYPYRNTYKKDLNKGWKGGVPGVLDLGWNSQTGHSGSADLIGLASVGWENGKVNSGDLIGVKYSKGKGITIDAVRVAMAAVTIVTAGAGSSLSVGANLAIQGGSAVGVGIGANMFGKKAESGGGFNRPTTKIHDYFWYDDYWNFYNDSKSENMYGSLYFQDMSRDVVSTQTDAGLLAGPNIRFSNSSTPFKANVYKSYRKYDDNGTVEREVGADISLHSRKTDASYYDQALRPISIAHDDFSVMGESVSGSIRPQRLEVGSVAYPRVGAEKHDKYSVVDYLDDYKVGFRYDNSMSNGYDYQQPTNSAGNTVADFTGYEIESSSSSLSITDKRLFPSTPPNRTETTRKGIVNGDGRRALVQGKHVQWYSNSEIIRQYQAKPAGDGSKLLEFYKPVQRNTSTQVITGYGPWICPNSDRTECYREPIYGTQTVTGAANPFRVTLPGKGIGAFAVTAEDGSTYHYSLPVYHYTSYSQSRELKAIEGDTPGLSTTMMGEPNKNHGYATTWLLTAITSPDYVDRGLVGTVDSLDWGGWVKFNYGKFSSNYKWRQPYVGENYLPDPSEYGKPGFMNTVSLSEGFKETYYLNSISTRTHTALFVKSTRTDGRGHFTPNGASNLGFYEQNPSSSLRLDEIILLTNEDLLKLRTQNAIREPSDGSATIPAFSTNTNNNANTFNPTELRNGDSYQQIYDSHDMDAHPRIREFINRRALKRILFNYSYRLCPGTPNSFASLASLPPMDAEHGSQARSGKLTLESVSIYGPLNTKLIPDTKFKYDNNPAYGREKWDYYGMYASGGWATSTNFNHQVANDFTQASQDGAAWSLTEIVNPLGGRTRFKYERDQYNQVSEFGTQKIALSNTNCSTTLTLSTTGSPGFSGDLRNYFKAGDRIQVNGSAKFRRTYYLDGVIQPREQCDTYYTDQWVTIKSVALTTITLNNEYQPEATCPPIENNYGQQVTNETITPQAFNLTTLITANRNGGEIRVAQVSTLDENNTEYQVRYRYMNAGLSGRNSTGVMSKEPEFIAGKVAHDFEAFYDYPATPVLYGNVTVLRGTFKNNQDTDHDQREEYAFFTPVSTMISEHTNHKSQNLANGKVATLQDNRTLVDVGKIGQPLSVSKFNGRGEQEFSTTFAYANQINNADGIAGQGRFTEGVMKNELLDRLYYHVNRTTKQYLPTVMTTTATVANGMRSEVSNEVYDFFTGQVLESTSRNALGDVFRTKIIPAYTLSPFQSMGAKGTEPGNRNMLSQTAAEHVFKEKGSTRSLVSASTSTWKRDWSTYREFDGSSDAYVNRTDAANPVWRKYESYVWQDERLKPDGTYATFTDFDWSNLDPAAQNKSWQRVAVINRYDHFSNQLEGQDLNGQYSSQKLGYEQTQGIAAASNARYTEIAYSGAEDQEIASNGVHFGGEVREGNRRSGDKAHTGNYSVLLTAGSPQGFMYKAKVGTAYDLRPDRKYRASVWIYAANSASGRLYATLNGTSVGETHAAASSTRKAGDWHLLTLVFNVPASASGQTLQVGCKNVGSGNVYMDDFRFQPLNSGMAAYVYDPHTRQATFALDNNNLFTRYQYDAAGKVVAVYKEVLDKSDGSVGGGKLVREATYNYARMKEPNWVENGVTRCVKKPSDNSNTGEQEKQEKDVNPLSLTYNQTRWLSIGYTGVCPTCTVLYSRWNGSSCETPVKSCEGSAEIYRSGTIKYQNTYRYTYSDGYSFTDVVEENYPCAL